MKHFAPCAVVLLFSFAAVSQEITFSEINYNSDSTVNSGNWVELFNFGATALDIGNWKVKDANDLNSYTIPSGTVLQPDARLVVVGDVPRFTATYPFTGNYTGPMDFGFSNDSDQVRLFDASGALKVFVSYTDSAPWPAAADGTGRTLELLDPQGDTNDPANWFVGCMFGSPGVAFIPCNDPLVFSEINYNSDTLMDAGDWVELLNRSAGYVNLTGYSFKDGNDDNHFDFPNNLQIAPGARLVLVHDPVRFQERHPDVTNWIGAFVFNLSNDGELIRIFDHNGRLKYSALYNDSGDWPELPDGDGYTLEFADTAWNPNIPTAWFSGCPEGSPGFAYDPECNIGMEDPGHYGWEVLYDAASQEIVVRNPVHGSTGMVWLLNLQGQVVHAGPVTAERIDAGSLPAGIYLIRIDQNDKLFAAKVWVHP